VSRPRGADLRIHPLANHHRRADFRCGVESLDRYLAIQARQDVRRLANGVFVLTRQRAPTTILGYYTLAATALEPGAVPHAARNHIPRYPLVSATLIGRLAVAASVQGQGLGGILLADALRRAHASASVIGSTMVVVDALDESAVAFYEKYGFIRLVDALRLVLPMRTIAAVLLAEP